MHYLKWKQYSDDIFVCENGEVKSHGKLLKGEITKAGYRRLHISIDGKESKPLVHSMVAELFLPNPLSLPCVNHINGNKLNNRVDNLEWCTYGENLSHAFSINLRNCNGENNPRSKLTYEQVCEIRLLYVKGKHCKNNSNGLAKKYRVSPRCILDIVKGKTWRY